MSIHYDFKAFVYFINLPTYLVLWLHLRLIETVPVCHGLTMAVRLEFA